MVQKNIVYVRSRIHTTSMRANKTYPVGLTGKYKLSSTDARLVCCCSCWFLPSLLLNFVLSSTVVFGVCMCVWKLSMVVKRTSFMWDLAFILHPCVQINVCSTIVFMCSRCARTHHHIHFLWYSWQKKHFQVKLHMIVSTNQNNIVLILFCVNTYQANYVKTTYKDNDIVYGCRWCRYQCVAEFNGGCMFSKHLNLALFR